MVLQGQHITRPIEHRLVDTWSPIIDLNPFSWLVRGLGLKKVWNADRVRGDLISSSYVRKAWGAKVPKVTAVVNFRGVEGSHGFTLEAVVPAGQFAQIKWFINGTCATHDQVNHRLNAQFIKGIMEEDSFTQEAEKSDIIDSITRGLFTTPWKRM